MYNRTAYLVGYLIAGDTYTVIGCHGVPHCSVFTQDTLWQTLGLELCMAVDKG